MPNAQRETTTDIRQQRTTMTMYMVQWHNDDGEIAMVTRQRHDNDDTDSRCQSRDDDDSSDGDGVRWRWRTTTMYVRDGDDW